jgi:hypothetical protein
VKRVKVREAEISVRRVNNTDCKEGEFRDKTKGSKNGIKQQKYEKKY